MTEIPEKAKASVTSGVDEVKACAEEPRGAAQDVLDKIKGAGEQLGAKARDTTERTGEDVEDVNDSAR